MTNSEKLGKPMTFWHIALLALIISAIALATSFEEDEYIWVAGDTLPSCHFLSVSDLVQKAIEKDSIPSNAIRNITSNLSVGKRYCIIEPLEADGFIIEDNLIEIPNQSLSNQSRLTIVGVPASHASSLGGSIKPRDIISLVVPKVLSNKSAELEPWSIENVTVLGILDNPSSNSSEEFTLMVLLPEDKALRLINETGSKKAIAIKEVS